MYSLIRNQKILYVFSLLLIIIYSGIDLLKSFLISFLFDKNLLKDIQTIILIVIVYLVAYLIILTLQQYTIEVLKNKIRYDLNKNVYQAYLSKTIQSFQEKDSSEILNEFNNEINVVTDTYVSAKLNIFSLTVSFIFGSAYIIHLSLEIFIFLFLCAVLTLFINTVFKKRLKENQKNYLSSMQQWLYSLKNFCRSFRDIKILNLENTFIHELDEKNKNLEQNILQNNGFIKLISSLNSFISIAMFFMTLLFGTLLIQDGKLSTGELLGISQSSNLVIMPIINYVNLRNAVISSKPIVDKLKKHNVIPKQKESIYFDDDISTIELRHLNFSYKNRTLFEDINLNIQKGKKYLIVGKSGVGKSTFLNILTKQKDSDCVYVNAKNLKDIPFKMYVGSFSYVSQNNDLLPFSFEKNITLGKKPSKYSLKELINQFQLESVFFKDRESLDVEHSNLSGGEKQRICIARAIYRNTKWLFLDEAFSAIDKSCSKKLHRFILSDSDITVLSIEHKISEEIINLYDEVLLLKNKKVYRMSVQEYIRTFKSNEII